MPDQPPPPQRRLEPRPEDRQFVRRLALAIAAGALVLFVWKAADLLLLVFGAVLVAILLSAVANWVARRTGVGRGWGLAAGVLLLFTLIGLIGWLFGAQTVKQAGALAQHLPTDWQALQGRYAGSPIAGRLLRSAAQIGGGAKAASFLTATGWGALEVLANFLIIIVGGIFFAAEPARYRRGIVLMVPPAYRGVAGDAADDVGRALRLWLVTQLVSMALMGIMIGAGLWLSGLPAWAALGLLGGLSEFIPYVGPTLAMIPALIVALAGQGSIWGVLATYLIARMVQANVITPLISQKLVHVPPGLYLFAILASGFAFGTYGLFFSGALAVTAYTLTLRLYLRETLGDPVVLPGEP